MARVAGDGATSNLKLLAVLEDLLSTCSASTAVAPGGPAERRHLFCGFLRKGKC